MTSVGPMRSVHVSVVIACPPDAAYALAADLERLPEWAAGLSAGVQRTDDPNVVFTDAPFGRVHVRFAAPNHHGVLDHDVTLPDGEVVANPLRIVAHPQGCEAIFTVRQRNLTSAEFARDCAAVHADLETLRHLLEA